MSKRQSRKKEKRSWKSALILLIIFSPLILYTTYNVFKRKELLKNQSTETLAIIEHLAVNKSKGSKSRKDVIYYRFQFGDSIIHTMEGEPSGLVSNLRLELGDVYRIKVVISDPSINEILYSKKVDTTLIFDPKLIHTYKSSRHKKIINGEISY
ncbi:MAG: hypothetical protein ACI8ZM_005680 [Crocinitomix sp.]|jgi:hypothetical protein